MVMNYATIIVTIVATRCGARSIEKAGEEASVKHAQCHVCRDNLQPSTVACDSAASRWYSFLREREKELPRSEHWLCKDGQVNLNDI